MLPTFKQIHPPKSLPVTAAIEKWKANYASHFPTAPAAGKPLSSKRKKKIDLLHLESESAVGGNLPFRQVSSIMVRAL